MIKDDRDRWKTLAEALESAIKEQHRHIGIRDVITCDICTFRNAEYDSNICGECRECKGAIHWQFDESRFAKEATCE